MTLLTPVGRGALSVVAVAGTGAIELVSRLFTPRGATALRDRRDGAIAFGTWRALADGPGEDLVVVRRRPDDVEIHCHGGLAAAEAVLASLEQLGGRRQPWPSWLTAGGVDVLQVEAREALARATGPKAARILSRQLAGALSTELARVESLVSGGDSDVIRAAVDRLVRASRVGLRLIRPWRVVVAGDANAGKSSLVNALAGHARCIVSTEAGTTRDVLETRIVLGGWEIDLVDTAGLRDAADVGETERAGISRAMAACKEADLVIRVCALTAVPMPSPPTVANEIRVLTKVDLVGDHANRGEVALRTSAVTGEGIDELAAHVVRRLVPEEIDDPTLLAGAVPFTSRQLRVVEGMRP